MTPEQRATLQQELLWLNETSKASKQRKAILDKIDALITQAVDAEREPLLALLDQARPYVRDGIMDIPPEYRNFSLMHSIDTALRAKDKP